MIKFAINAPSPKTMKTSRILALSALIVALTCELPKLAAQATNHNDLFTKPATLTHAATASPASSTADFSAAPPVEQQLHLVVGRSTFVNTKHRLTRVYVTAPSVLDTYTASPNQIVVTAKKPGVSSLIVWDEAGESQSFMVTADLNISMLRDAMKQALPNDNVTVDGSEGRVVLSGTIGTDKISDQALKMAAMYSKDVTNALVVNPAQVKQVTLKVRIVEVDRSKLNAFAFNFFNTSGKLLAGTTTGQVASTLSVSGSGGADAVSVSNPLNFLLYSARFNIGATLQDLETLNVLQILAEPSASPP